MKIPSLLLFITISFVISCSQPEPTAKPRVAIIGLGIESSVFSPARTVAAQFHPKTGPEIFEKYPFLHQDSVLRNSVDWVPTLVGKALPGGIVTQHAYDSLVEASLELLKAQLPLDGIFFDIHGAMSVEGLDDAEGDYIEKIREITGSEVIISTSMDLHGNVSEKLVSLSDLITCYRMAPHEDAIESKRRAVTNLIQSIQDGHKPTYKAYIPVPILLPGEQTSTRIEPGKSLYAKVAPLTKQEGITDAAIWIGYAWGDAPRNHAAVVVTGDDEKAVQEGAEMLAQSFWDVRNEFDFVAPTAPLDTCLKKALSSEKKPFMISDMGDNPTAGGAGDVTWTLAQLLNREEFKTTEGPELIYASIPGPDLIAKIENAQPGDSVLGYAGAEVDDRFAPPLLLNGILHSVKHGDVHAETEAVVQVGSIKVIVTKKRKPYHHESDFTDLDLNPREADIVVVKIGYLVPELYDMRGDWIMALTPGGVDQDLQRLGYQHIKRPMFPLDPEMETPDLSAKMIR